MSGYRWSHILSMAMDGIACGIATWVVLLWVVTLVQSPNMPTKKILVSTAT